MMSYCYSFILYSIDKILRPIQNISVYETLFYRNFFNLPNTFNIIPHGGFFEEDIYI